MPFTIQERTNDLPRTSDADLPLAREAKNLYEQTHDGQSTGLDPLSGDDALILQRSDYFKRISTLPKFLEKSQMANPSNSNKLYFNISQQQTGSPNFYV